MWHWETQAEEYDRLKRERRSLRRLLILTITAMGICTLFVVFGCRTPGPLPPRRPLLPLTCVVADWKEFHACYGRRLHDIEPDDCRPFNAAGPQVPGRIDILDWAAWSNRLEVDWWREWHCESAGLGTLGG